MLESVRNKNLNLFVYGLCTVLACTGFALDLIWELGIAGGVPYIILIIPGLLFHDRRAILVAAIIGSTLTITGYFLSPIGGELWKVFINRSLALFAIWVTAWLCLLHLQREKKLRLSNNLLDAITDAQSRFIQEANSILFFEELLAKTLSLTQSEFGFIAELTKDSYGKPFLKSLANTNIRWEDENNKAYKKFLKTGLELYNFDSLYGAVLATREPVISNAPSTDLRRGGLPEGHPPLHSFLGLPFIHNNELFGMVCLANRDGGYNKNIVEYLQPFVETCGNLVRAHQNEIKRQRVEKKLNEAENRLYRVVRDAPIPLMIHSEDGQVHMVNKIWTQLTGYDLSDIPTINDWARKACGEKEPQVLKEIQKLYSIDKLKLEGSFPITTSSGEKQVWDFRSSPLGRLPNGLRYVISMAMDITCREDEKSQLEVSLEQLRNLSNRLQTIREEERRHIAREVHDEIGQLLTGLKYDFNWVKPRISESQLALREKIVSMEKLIDVVMETVQRITSDLHPTILDNLGICEAIEWQVKEFQEKTGIQCVLSIQPSHIDLNDDQAIMIYRILQETLTNVARHADASRIHINFMKNSEQICLTIRDNGKGISQTQVYSEWSMGILGMRERARLWGGEFHIKGVPENGTFVTLRVPLINRDGTAVADPPKT
ncbi:MAG: hypothetical protein NPINA01_08900 [Nitrospinaceae bacterium]|nr:MAG: hypothetical protein NPINA01_08900 [Nitrospinaceae bacterium]